MARYQIEVTEEAATDLRHYPAAQRKVIVDAIRVQLAHEPLTPTRNRKRLRQNPISAWEIRVGRYRVLYDVREEARTVIVTAVGHKEHNGLYVRGKKVEL